MSESVLSAVVESLGWALLHFAWQGALVAALFGVARLVLHGASPRVRLWAGYAALLALALAPAATFLRHLSQSLSAPVASAQALVPASVGEAAATAGRLVSIETLLPWLVAAWFAGVLVLSVRGFRQWRALRRLCTAALPCEPDWQERLAAMCRRMGVRQRVQLRECALVVAPMVVGWLKPVILLPAGLVLRLPREQVELLLAHELAHVRRLDYLANLLQMVLETALFYHPAVHWVSRCVRDDREQCCDDLVTGRYAGRLDYARALLSLAESYTGPRVDPAVAATGGALLARIERIVGVPRSSSPAAASTPLLVLAAAVLLAAMGLRALVPAERGTGWDALLPGAEVMRLVLPATRLAVADLADELGRGAGLAAPRVASPVASASGASAGATLPAPEPLALEPAPPSLAAPAIAREPVGLVPPGAPPAGADAPEAPAALPASQPMGVVPLSVQAPEYPRAARIAGVQGWVTLSYAITPDGRVDQVRVENVHPSRVFVPAAREALSQWRFPAGAGAGERFQQTFDFVLDGNARRKLHCDVATGSHICRERLLEAE